MVFWGVLFLLKITMIIMTTMSPCAASKCNLSFYCGFGSGSFSSILWTDECGTFRHLKILATDEWDLWSHVGTGHITYTWYSSPGFKQHFYTNVDCCSKVIFTFHNKAASSLGQRSGMMAVCSSAVQYCATEVHWINSNMSASFFLGINVMEREFKICQLVIIQLKVCSTAEVSGMLSSL